MHFIYDPEFITKYFIFKKNSVSHISFPGLHWRDTRRQHRFHFRPRFGGLTFCNAFNYFHVLTDLLHGAKQCRHTHSCRTRCSCLFRPSVTKIVHLQLYHNLLTRLLGRFCARWDQHTQSVEQIHFRLIRRYLFTITFALTSSLISTSCTPAYGIFLAAISHITFHTHIYPIEKNISDAIQITPAPSKDVVPHPIFPVERFWLLSRFSLALNQSP